MAAPNASITPVSHSGPTVSLLLKRVGTSSTNTSPIRITPIKAAVRALGRDPPSAQVSSASRIGKTFATSSATATGMRATAEYRHRLCVAINRPSSNCQRHAPGARRIFCRCQITRPASTTSVPPERMRIASSTPAPSSKATRAATWLPANEQPMQSRISTAICRGKTDGVASEAVVLVMGSCFRHGNASPEAGARDGCLGIPEVYSTILGNHSEMAGM